MGAFRRNPITRLSQARHTVTSRELVKDKSTFSPDTGKDKRKLPRWAKCGCLLFSAGAILLCIAIISIPTLYTGYHYAVRHFPERFTEPLEPAIAAELCKTLQLSEQDSRCQGKDIYALEFFPDFRNRYPRWTPRQQVDDEIGAYLARCDEWMVTASDGAHQYCSYDFKGDGVFTLDIDFSKSYSDSEESGGVVWDTCTYTIRNSSAWVIFVCNPPLSS